MVSEILSSVAAPAATGKTWFGMQMIDWASIIGYFVLSLVIGLVVAKRAGKSSSEFFLGGRTMPWWLLGISLVATTFSTDTPNLVTGLVREKGVAGNWAWWAFLLTGMATVFIYAKLWRRSGAMTDIEFYEMRYSGKPAAFLRGFRAIYLGFFFNIMIMGMVSVAAIKIGRVMFNLEDWQTLSIAGFITVFYCSLGGFMSVLVTDFVQFGIAMFGAVIAAVYAVNHEDVGGLTALINHDVFKGTNTLNMMPDFAFSSWELWLPIFAIPLLVQWWSAWYPGAEPGGGGYVAQRMLSAKNENHAMGATLMFNCMHYALRPWPWIIVALASMIVFPDLESIRTAFPEIAPEYLKNDIAYPAMLKTVLPPGLLGLVVASLIAAYMSTIATHLNWGSSYMVNDVYKRFIKPDADEKKLVFVGRISTVVMMVFACILATLLQDAVKAFQILLSVGAGTGLLFLMRWFWWRINAWSEISAMVISFFVAFFFHFTNGPDAKYQLFDIMPEVAFSLGVLITTIGWIVVTFATQPDNDITLRNFVKKTRPGGPGWARIYKAARADGEPIEGDTKSWDVPTAIICMIFGCICVYSALFATGYWLYSQTMPAVILSVASLVFGVLMMTTYMKMEKK